jgi:molybdenum cofactor biosynthesis protein MoaC
VRRNALARSAPTLSILRVRVYQFDELDAELSLLPMAARRALDHAGCKLSLTAWQSLPRVARELLIQLGSGEAVDSVQVRLAAQRAEPAAVEFEPVPDPPVNVVPDVVLVAFGAERPIPAGTWAALTHLDRYALCKVAGKARPARLSAAYTEIVGASALSSHLEPQGGVRMVNVGAKPTSERQAEAEARVVLSRDAFAALTAGTAPKGDVLAVARVAAIMAAKRTPDLIPLCHSIALTQVRVHFELDADHSAVWVRVVADAVDRTGVEMEAMAAASIAALTIYDMLKGIDRSIEIGPVRVNRKAGGRTGDYQR